MTKSDLPVVDELEKAVFSDAWPSKTFREILADKAWCARVAEVDCSVIGYSCHIIIGREAHLANLAVHPEYRRKSVAKRLLEHIIQLARESRCEMVLLEVRPTNGSARAFYKKFEFVELFRKPNYYTSPVEDALVMVRWLEESKTGK